MGSGSIKKAKPAKTAQTPARPRRSTARVTKSNPSPVRTPPRSSSKETAYKSSGYTSRLPSETDRRSNGRVPGRSLIVWGRPRMTDKMLLHLQYECARHKVQVPWDAIAHRLHPGSSGAALVQHLGHLRRELVAEGHLVPPVAGRNGQGDTQDPEVRGYVRADLDGDDKETTRPVRFEEYLEDRKMTLPNAFIEESDEEPAGSRDRSATMESEGSRLVQSSPAPYVVKDGHLSVSVPSSSRITPELDFKDESPYSGRSGSSAPANEPAVSPDAMNHFGKHHVHQDQSRLAGHSGHSFHGGYAQYPYGGHMPGNAYQASNSAFSGMAHGLSPYGEQPGLLGPLPTYRAEYLPQYPQGHQQWPMGYSVPEPFGAGDDHYGHGPNPVHPAPSTSSSSDPLDARGTRTLSPEQAQENCARIEDILDERVLIDNEDTVNPRHLMDP